MAKMFWNEGVWVFYRSYFMMLVMNVFFMVIYFVVYESVKMVLFKVSEAEKEGFVV